MTSKMIRPLGCSLIMCLFCVVTAFAQHTYYISKSTGSDSNTAAQAQSKSTPWAHLPGMASCTSNCNGYTPRAGDTFVMMGCDVWVASDLPVAFPTTNSGSSGSPITFGGEDQTWYNTTNCPSGWNRPVFSNSTHTYLANANCNNDGSSQQSQVFVCLGVNTSPGAYGYIVIDNIEMTGLTCTGNCTGQQDYIWMPSCNYCKVTNNYWHGIDIAYDGNCTIVKAYETNSVFGSLFQQNIMDGSDRANQDSGKSACTVFFGDYGGVTIDGNIMHDVPNTVTPYASGGDSIVISRNNSYNILVSNGGSHCNGMENVGGGTFYIHDNVIHDMYCPGGESYMMGNSNETTYFWNNVFYNLCDAGAGNCSQTPQFPQTSGQGPIALYFWNNTIVSPTAQSCFSNSSQPGFTITALAFENTHCITTGSLADTWTGVTPTEAGNVTQTPTATDSNVSPHYDQYTASETYAYSPVASTNSTVGAGTNLTSNCSGSSAGLCSDTAYACSLQTSPIVEAVCPARTSNTRPSTGNWDAGAYEYNVQDPPNPPTNLTAVVQ